MPSSSATQRSPAGASLDEDSVAAEMELARSGLATQLSGLTPQQHRVPPPRAGPAAARPRRAPAGHADRGALGGRGGARLRPRGRAGRRPRVHPRAAPGRRRGRCRRGRRCDASGVRADVVVLDAAEELPAGGRAARGSRRGGPRRPGQQPRGRRADRAAGRPPVADRDRRRARGRRSGARRRRRPDASSSRVGMRATVSELLDSQRPGVAGTYLTRLKLGPRLVDAAAVPHLYSGRVRPWHLLLVMLAGFVALAAAISVTPVGHEWAQDWAPSLSDLSDLYDQAWDSSRDLVPTPHRVARRRLPRSRRRRGARRRPAQRPRPRRPAGLGDDRSGGGPRSAPPTSATSSPPPGRGDAVRRTPRRPPGRGHHDAGCRRGDHRGPDRAGRALPAARCPARTPPARRSPTPPRSRSSTRSAAS